MADKLTPVYQPKHLVKINAMRQAESVEAPPGRRVTKGQVLYVTAASRNDEPNSCYNCIFFNAAKKRCALMSDGVIIRKLTTGLPFKAIDYFPVCGYQVYGKPNGANHPAPEYPLDPDYAGLIWTNVPEYGKALGGVSCGGQNNGDDCDYWEPLTNVKSKRDETLGICKLLDCPTNNGDCCAAWQDDDAMSWQNAQTILRKTEK